MHNVDGIISDLQRTDLVSMDLGAHILYVWGAIMLLHGGCVERLQS